MLKHFKQLIKPVKKPKIQVKYSDVSEQNVYDDGISKQVTMFKYFILDKSNMKILDEIELTPDQARKINDSMKDIAFIRQ
jgi:hypothetical protein